MTQQFWMFWLPDHQTLYGFGSQDLAMQYQAYLKTWGDYNVTEVPEDVTSDLLDLNTVTSIVALSQFPGNPLRIGLLQDRKLQKDYLILVY